MVLCVPPHLLKAKEDKSFGNTPSSALVSDVAELFYDDYTSRQKEKVNELLQMPETERTTFLCKKTTYPKCVSDHDWPFDYVRVTTAEVDWFTPKFRMILLNSLSSQNLVKVLNTRVEGKRVYENLPQKNQEEILKKLSLIEKQVVLNPPPTTMQKFMNFFGFRKGAKRG